MTTLRKGITCMVFLILLMAYGLPASAQNDSFLQYQLPADMTIYPLSAVEAPKAPAGLQAMYQLMQNYSSQSDTYLFCPKNGRALVSASHTPVTWQQDPQELLNAWPTIAAVIGRSVSYINDEASCASLKECYGHEALYIDTTAVIMDDEQSMLLALTCTAFYQGDSLVEIWTVMPSALSYLYDKKAADELSNDQQDIAMLLTSFNFTQQDMINDTAMPLSTPAPTQMPDEEYVVHQDEQPLQLDEPVTQEPATDVSSDDKSASIPLSGNTAAI